MSYPSSPSTNRSPIERRGAGAGALRIALALHRLGQLLLAEVDMSLGLLDLGVRDGAMIESLVIGQAAGFGHLLLGEHHTTSASGQMMRAEVSASSRVTWAPTFANGGRPENRTNQ